MLPNGNFILSHLHRISRGLNSISLIVGDLINESDPIKRSNCTQASALEYSRTMKESRELFETLSKNLITPFDREDIYALGSGLKGVSSKSDSLIRYIYQNQCNIKNIGLVDLTSEFIDATASMMKFIEGLETLKQHKNAYESIVHLKKSVTTITEICDRSRVHSLDDIQSTRLILINIDLYTYFEVLAEKLKDLSQISEGFLVKYA